MPTDDLISKITINPGGATVDYFGVEDIALVCDTCPPPPPLAAALMEMASIEDRGLAAQQSVGAYTSTQDMDYSFETFLRRQVKRRQLRSEGVSSVEEVDTVELDWLESAESEEVLDALFESEDDFFGRRFF